MFCRREEREREAREAEERDRWRGMSEEERAAWLLAHPRDGTAGGTAGDKDKKKWRFLQKYWHKGAFFQSTGDGDDASGGGGGGLGEEDVAAAVARVVNRDYSAPTGEDKFDRAALPEVMQVRGGLGLGLGFRIRWWWWCVVVVVVVWVGVGGCGGVWGGVGCGEVGAGSGGFGAGEGTAGGRGGAAGGGGVGCV